MANKKKSLPVRLSAALLALVMVLTLVPAAQAETVIKCAECGSTNGKSSEIRSATCATDGRYEYTCPNPNCNLYNIPQSISVGYDPSNHEAAYTDNGDGTHTGVCTYHVSHISDVYIGPEKHTPGPNGVCTKCGAVDYSKVVLNMPETLTIPVALNSASAKLSVGEVKLTLGSAGGTDITGDYTIYYNWYYNGTPVANTAEYTLPTAITDEVGTYRYTLFVSAVPPQGSSRSNVSGSCDVTVQVKELITASATVSQDDGSLYLGDPDSWSGESVSAQIYAAVQDICSRSADPDYVVFQTLPNSTVGSLAVNTSTRYYFEDYASKARKPLDDVLFSVSTASSAAVGDYTISFIVYDTDGKSYEGVLTITVQQYAGDMDVVLATAKDGLLTLSAGDFEDFWNNAYPSGVLDSITFKETPRSTEGSLYVDYISASAPGLRVTAKDAFYVAPGRNQYGIDQVTFVPGVKQTEYITLDFEAQGTKNTGRVGYLSGTLYIFIQDSGSADVKVAVSAAGTALSPEDFQKAYQSATGGTGSSFYIQLLDVPAKGELYAGRTATRQGTLLTQRTVSSYPLSYSDSRGETISTITYVPAAGTATESIRYVACSSQGKPLYTGNIIFTFAAAAPVATSGLTVDLNSSAAGVKLSSSSFENLLGNAGPKLTTVIFTAISTSYGTFYYGRTDTSPGTAVSLSNTNFSTVSVNPPVGTLSLDSLTFVPAAGVAGVIPIPFTASDASGSRYTGTLRIAVSATGTTPGTATTPGTSTTPGTAAQTPKTFSDVPKTAGSYPYITALTTSGALSGYEDGTFKPGNPVTLGEALKLIMWVANPAEYSDLPPVSAGDHWASGYLDRAIKDGLLPAGINQNLDWNASRYAIAEIMAKAMHLAPVMDAAVSPFSDMALTVSYAPYVLALYNVKIIEGNITDGVRIYQGSTAIKREDFATIIWRMQSYMQNGYVGTISAG